jgi:Chaperone of endosialidase
MRTRPHLRPRRDRSPRRAPRGRRGRPHRGGTRDLAAPRHVAGWALHGLSSDNTIGRASVGFADDSVIGGGTLNMINAPTGFIGGGSENVIECTDCPGAAILGGSTNAAFGAFATVAGGTHNLAAKSAFAAGSYATAFEGCFVFGDASVAHPQFCDVNRAPALNAFVARATGGVQFVTAVQPNGDFLAGVYVGAGGQMFQSGSDRNSKHDIFPVDPEAVLDRVLSLPIATWRYRSEASQALHMGPMAQDFYEAFALGDDDRHIGGLDEPGVALAAIQGLHARVVQRDEAIIALEAKLVSAEETSARTALRADALERRLEAIEARMARLGSAP